MLRDYLTRNDSRIVKVSTLQALADLAQHDNSSRLSVSRLVREALETGLPSLKARVKKLQRDFLLDAIVTHIAPRTNSIDAVHSSPPIHPFPANSCP